MNGLRDLHVMPECDLDYALPPGWSASLGPQREVVFRVNGYSVCSVDCNGNYKQLFHSNGAEAACRSVVERVAIDGWAYQSKRLDREVARIRETLGIA